VIRKHLPSLALLLVTGTGSVPALAQPAPTQAAAPTPAPSAPQAPATPDNEAEGFKSRIEHELGISGGLTSDDVARRAVATSYSLEASRAKVAVAAADVDRAFAAYIPKLTLLARYTRLSKVDSESEVNVVGAPGVTGPIDNVNQLFAAPLSFDTPLNQYTFQANLNVPVSDYFLRVSKAHDSSQLAETAARKDLARTELQTAADAKTTYYGWVSARLSLIVSTQALEDAKAHLADVKNALEAGTASQADVLAIESRVADSERLVETGQNLVQELEEQLRIIRHDPPNTAYRVGETLADEPAAVTPERLADLTRTAIAQRPELVALELRAKAVQKQASVERAGNYPRLDLFANAHYDNPNQRVFPLRDEFKASWDAGVQLSWTPTDIANASASARSQSANAEALLAERRALTDRVRAEVSAAYRALQDARAAIRTSEKSLAAAEESHRVRRVLFQNGRATSVEVMDAELELTRARLVAVTARIDLRVARVRLDYALGRDTVSPDRPG
jgi:outer membrane protein TolC